MNGATNRHTSLTPLLNKEGQGEVLHHKRVSLRIPVFCLSVFLTAMSCINTPLPNTGILNPFTELPAITPDGTPHDLTANIVPLGPLERNDVIRIDASGPNIVAVFILIRDDIVGGGPANTPFQYRIQTDNDYYVFIQFSATATALQRTGTIAVAPGDPTYRPPSQQRVLITFEQGYLHSPGRVYPDSDPPENQTLLASISDTVRHEVIRKLRTIFADTPIQIVSEDDPAPAEPFSRVTFSPKRILAAEQDVTDNRHHQPLQRDRLVHRPARRARNRPPRRPAPRRANRHHEPNRHPRIPPRSAVRPRPNPDRPKHQRRHHQRSRHKRDPGTARLL